MSRDLLVGDMHVKPTNLIESKGLAQFILSKALELKVDRVVFLGDLVDTHEIVRLRCLEFWDYWFDCFADQEFKTIVLVGNHDLTGDYSNAYSALHPFVKPGRENFKIVISSYIDGCFGYLPYIHDDAQFVESANQLAAQGATVLISHPNYIGAVYDNGMPINFGVDPNDLDPRFKHLIGGHIHTAIEYGRVWYTGTPRWINKSCANKDKGIWLINYDDSGSITSKEFISTKSVCTPIVSLVWNEGQEKPVLPENAKVDIELIGSSDWVSKTKKELVGSVSVSSKITDIKKSRERRSGKSLFEFISKHYETDKREKLLRYMEKLNLV